MFSSIGLGVLVSSIARTPHQALYFTWFILVFFVLLSGFFLPVENMPRWIAAATGINPLRYFMAAVRDIFLKGAGLGDLWRDATAMLAIGAGVYGLALASFRRKSG
jgi:ABC-2 type transport system permease protein